MGQKFKVFDVSEAQRDALDRLSIGREWTVLDSGVLAPLLPTGYVSKIDGVVALGVPTSSGGECVLLNALRVDFRTKLVDQEPLALFRNSTALTTRAVVEYHGQWDNRSWQAPKQAWSEWWEDRRSGYYVANVSTIITSSDGLPRGIGGALTAVTRRLRSL